MNRNRLLGEIISESESAAALLGRRGVGQGGVGLVLGSGLGRISTVLGNAAVVPFREIPGMPQPGTPGHEGLLHAGMVGGLRVVVLQGRSHFYEGVSVRKIVYPIFLLQALGVRKVLFTCAAGGVSPSLETGDLLVVRDHVDISRMSPLRELQLRGFGRFLDMIEAYDPGLSSTIEAAAGLEGIAVRRGVLGALPGPAYESNAEIELLRRAGVDAITMSTVPEVIAARYAGMTVACITLVTNVYRPGGEQHTTHESVITTAASAIDSMQQLVVATARFLHDKH